MIQFLRRLRGKKSHVCAEDLEMEEKDAERVLESNQSSFPCRVDHQSSVTFAQDLKKRSEATSTVNLFESLNILLRGRRKMKEYEDDQERGCDSEPIHHVQKSGQKTIISKDVCEDNYSSKKLPEENHYSEQLDSTQTSIPGQDVIETMESKCASLTHPEDGCEGKSENKQSKGDSKCVKSSDCTKRNENARCAVRTQSSSGSSAGNGDEDEDEDDENKKRRRKEEKFDDVQVIAVEEEETDENIGHNDEESEIMAAENSGIQEPLSVNQEVSVMVQQTPEAADEEVPAKDVEVQANQKFSARIQQTPEATDEEVPANNAEVPANQKVSAIAQETPEAADEEVPAKDVEVPDNQKFSARIQQTPEATDEKVPANQEVYTRDQQALAADQEVPAKDVEVPANQEVYPWDQQALAADQKVPAKDVEVPANQGVYWYTRDQQALAADKEVPAKDVEVPANQGVYWYTRDQQALAADQEVPAKDVEVPANQGVYWYTRDQQALAADQEVPAKDVEVPANQGVYWHTRDQQALAADQEVPAKDEEVHVIDGKALTKEEEALEKKFEKRTRSLCAAFRCHGEKAGVIDTCKNCICYSTHRLLDHSRKCKFRVLGGCKKCEELRDTYVHHVNNCNDDKCVITQCQWIKEFLKENHGKCPERWSYHADKTFFGDRLPHVKPWNIPQHHGTQQPVTTEEIEEFLHSFQTPLNSISSTHQYSLPEKILFRTKGPGIGENAYMYHPRRPPDDVEQSSICGAQDKSPVSGITLSHVAVTEWGSNKTESLPCTSSGLHSRGVSVRIEEAEEYEQEALSIVSIEKDEGSFPRPDVQLMHPLDETKLNVKDGRYDENHEWRIVHDQNFLGRGAFGVVRLCTDLSSNKLFAAKIIQRDKFESPELDIWASVSGRSVRCLELLGAVCVDNSVIMFMEYMEGGSVETMLSYLRKNRFNEYSALYIIREVLEGLDFLHCNRIIHRDVKGGNILVNPTLTKIKVADYGAAVKLDNHEFSRQENIPPGTENFMAPEVCRSEEHSFSSDIWSAGCSLYQMLKGEPPWMNYPSVIYKVGNTKEPPPFPKCSEPTTDLLNQMFILIPQDRPTAKELLQHRIFEEVNNPPEQPPSFISDEEDDEDESQGDDNEQESSSEDEFFSFEDEEEEEEEEEDDDDDDKRSLDENEQPAEYDPSLAVSDHAELLAYHSYSGEDNDETPVMGESALGEPELGGPVEHFGSSNQPSTPPIGVQSPVFHGGPSQHFESTPPVGVQSPVFLHGGPSQHFGSPKQPSTPPVGVQRPVFLHGGPSQHFESTRQPSTPPVGVQRPVFHGGPSQHFESTRQPSTPPVGVQRPVFHGGPSQHFESPRQPSTPPVGVQRPVFHGGPSQHFESPRQPSTPPVGVQSPGFGRPGQHFESPRQPSTPPVGVQRPVFHGGPSQHFESPRQPSTPPVGVQSPGFGRPGQHFESPRQPSTPPVGGQSPGFGRPGQHFESPRQPSTPPVGGQSPVFGRPGQHFGSPDRPSSLASDPMDELQRLQSDLLQKVSLEGGDVSDFIGMSGSWLDVVDNEQQDDVFDISSLEEDNQEMEPVCCPRRTYSLRDLTRVELYDANGKPLFTVREKTSCTFGHLAENLHSKIREKNPAFRCFTFTFKEADDASIDPNQELGFQDHEIVVLPAREGDQWAGWRIDHRGIVELQD